MQTGGTDTERLTENCVYEGRVMSIDLATRKLTVSVLNDVVVSNAVMMSDSLSSLLGFTQTNLPPVGAKVLLVYTAGVSFVVGAYGANFSDNPTLFSVPAGGEIFQESLNLRGLGVVRPKETPVQAGFTPGRDLAPGEREYSNNMGVFIRMLMHLAQMSAGELAKVEVGLINDMVRIVDNYFVHHSVGGDTLIWSNTRCNYEDHFTGYPFEAEGKRKENEVLAEEVGKYVVDPESMLENRYSDTGRWRKSTYMGFLGDMIHTWVTEPTRVLSTYADNATRAGAYSFWVGSDGNLVIQSASAVHVEVRPYISVPSIKAKWDDPEKGISEKMDDLDKKYLKLWDGAAGSGWEHIGTSCWRMRDYARYLTQWHALARWRQVSETDWCGVQDESEVEVPTPTCEEKDKKQANPASNTAYTGAAVFDMDPSGSISLISYGDATDSGVSSVILNKGNVQIAAPGNISITCGGTFSVQAKNVSILSAATMELVSLAGGIWAKARTALNMLCEKGRIWIKSDMDPAEGVSTAPEPASADFPYDDDGNPYSIVLEANKGTACVTARDEVCVATSGPEGSVYVQADGGAGSVNISSSNVVNIFGGINVLIKSIGVGVSSLTTYLASQAVKITERILCAGGSIEMEGQLIANSVATKAGYIGPAPTIAKPKEPVEPDATKEGEMEPVAEVAGLLTKETTQSLLAPDLPKSTWALFKWDTPSADPDSWESIKAAPYIDAAVHGNTYEVGSDQNLTKIEWTKCGLSSTSPNTDKQSFPYPGKNAKMIEFTSDLETLSKPSSKKIGEDITNTFPKLKPTEYTFYIQS